ncbi:LuxR C-terminal-related transcriptional regulator [Maridesulfovibrio sp.]|uniref:LuxR C-terminal-related transcriptional regulator n=1 Tax=Maridesulfovibrio sp. TaxID=2795000 RepID=UPI002A186C59|nr:LuxR C-terminal-related transcriptional regulator [Maridesulfovibrio sp.]
MSTNDDSGSPERLTEQISDVFGSVSDFILFTDCDGFIRSANAHAKDFFDGPLDQRRIWSLLEVDVPDMAPFLKLYPPGSVHEIPYGKSGGSYSLRLIPLEGPLCSDGYVAVVTNNAPFVELHETYEERIEDNIAALDDSITLFNALFEGAQDPTILADSFFRILTSNPASEALFGRGPSLSGNSCLNLFDAGSARIVRECFETCGTDTKMSMEGDLTAVDASGREIPVELSMHKVRLQSGTVFHLGLRDMSDILRLETGLEESREQVDGMNVALRTVIESVEEEKRDMHEEFAQQVREQILPALDRMMREPLPQMRISFGKFIKERLCALAGETGDQLDDLLLRLTPREVEICRYIEAGKSTEHIAELLSITADTVRTHRKNIRRRLGLRGKNISLVSYLKHQAGS